MARRDRAFIDHDKAIGRLFESVDRLLLEEGGSAPLEPEDMEGESDPVEPVGRKGDRIAKVASEYAKALDTAKGAQAWLHGINAGSDKGEVGVLLAKAKVKAIEGLKALQKAVSDLEKL